MTSENRPNSPTERNLFAGIAVLALLAKLLLAAVIPLSADESYYWVWTRHLDFGYYDHPPMVAWLFALGKFLEPFGHAVRWPAVILAHGSIALWGWMLKDAFPERAHLVWLGLFLACPLTGIGGIVVTPDLPLLFFWSLSLFFLFRIAERPRARFFFGLGFALGLGFCSKYHIVLLPLSLLPLLASREIRRTFLHPGLVLTFMTGLIFCAPVLGWNSTHDWLSFRFQLDHGLGSRPFDWRWPLEYLGGEALLLFPTVIFAFIRAGVEGPRRKVLWAAAVGPLVFFLLTSFKAPVELNWPFIAFPAAFALAATTIGRKAFRGHMAFWTLAQMALVVSIFVPGGFALHEKLSEPTRFKVLAELPKTSPPLYASTYQMASSLWYVSGVPVYKLRGMSRIDMYDAWEGSLPPRGRFRLLREPGQNLPPEADAEGWTIRNLGSPAPNTELLEIDRP